MDGRVESGCESDRVVFKMANTSIQDINNVLDVQHNILESNASPVQYTEIHYTDKHDGMSVLTPLFSPLLHSWS